MDITRGVEHTLSTGEGLTLPLGLFTTVKEAPTPGRGHAADTWAILEDSAASQGRTALKKAAPYETAHPTGNAGL